MRSAAAALALAIALAVPAQALAASDQDRRGEPPHRRAQEAIDRGEPAEALELLDGWLRTNPRDAEAHLLRSTALFMSGDTRRGVEELDRALELDPNLRQAWLNRGALELAVGDYAAAQRAFEEAERIDPAAADNALNIGAVLLLQGDLSAATGRFRDYLERNSDSAEAYYLVASNYAMTGYVQPTIQALDYAIRLDEKSRRRARVDPNFSDVARDPRFRELLATDSYRPPPGSLFASRDFDAGFTGRNSRILSAVLRALEVTGEPFDRQVEVAEGWALVWAPRFRVKVSRVELALTRVELTAPPTQRFRPGEWKTVSEAFFRAVTLELVKLSRGGTPPPEPGS